MTSNQEFEDITAHVRRFLDFEPNHLQALELYGLYKQATEGDINIQKPGFFDFKGKAKWEAWQSKKGLSRQAAKDAYVELAKNVLPTRGHNLGSTDGVDENWVEVVRGVLPQVPVAVIRRELLVTKNVDDTIARILDGTVYYEPEVPTITPETSQISSKPSESSAPIPSEEPIEPNDPVSPMTFNTKAVSFERNSQQRMKSYQERKEQLLEVARKHFIEKYGLQPK